MTIPAALESISSQDGDGSVAHGIHREVITGKSGTTPYQLLPEESGALVVTNDLAGAVYRLPAPVKGLWYEFITQIAATSNEEKVVTKDITTDFLIGAVIQASETLGSSMDVFVADGTSNDVSISQNVHSANTGGEVGNHIFCTAINSTQWFIKGVQQHAATAADDPFDSS